MILWANLRKDGRDMLRYIEWAYPKTGHEVVGYIYIYFFAWVWVVSRCVSGKTLYIVSLCISQSARQFFHGSDAYVQPNGQTAPPRQEIPSWGQGKGRWSCYEGPLSGSNLWCLRGRCPWNSTKLDFNSDVAFGNQTWQWMFFPSFRGWSNLNAYLRWICQPVMSQERIPKFGPSFSWKMIFTHIYIYILIKCSVTLL